LSRSYSTLLLNLRVWTCFLLLFCCQRSLAQKKSGSSVMGLYFSRVFGFLKSLLILTIFGVYVNKFVDYFLRCLTIFLSCLISTIRAMRVIGQ
jgi:hypothetical protein